MIKVVPELRQELIKRGLWSSFVYACERSEKSGVKGANSIRDDAIDEVCPDLNKFKKRKTVKKIEVVADEREAIVADSSCNGFRMLEWVVENFEHKEANEGSAPSRAAWAILLAARRDEDTYRDVLKKYMDSKLKLDMSTGDTDTRKLDGQCEYDILEGLELEVGG